MKRRRNTKSTKDTQRKPNMRRVITNADTVLPGVGTEPCEVRQAVHPDAARRRREACGLDVRDVASMTGVSREVVEAWESCEKWISRASAMSIDNVYFADEMRRESQARKAAACEAATAPPAPSAPILVRIDEVNALFGKALMAYAELIRAEERERIAKGLAAVAGRQP